VGAPITTKEDKSYRAGIELIFGARITPWLSWNANATISQNKIKEFTEYVDNWDTWGQDSTNLGTTNIAFSPNFVGANQFQITPIKNLDIYINTKYVGKQYIDNSSNDYNSLDAYSTTDFVFHYSFNPKWFQNVGISFSIHNIFDAQYVSNAWVYSYNETNTTTNQLERNVIDGYFPQAGINFMVGLDFKF
jgi:iron complex outermembrane receptor protein